MNLSYRFAKAFTILVFAVLLLGFAILYYAFERTTMRSAIVKMEDLNAYVAGRLSKDPEYDYFNFHHRQTRVALLKEVPSDKEEKIIEEKYIWNRSIQSYINRISVSSFFMIKGKPYRITSVRYITVIEKRFLLSLVMVVAWIMVFLVILSIIISVLISRKILDPFYHALEEIKKFSIKDRKPMQLMETGTYEFRLLNGFLTKMSENSKKDYYLLEELTENTSHELQTPLASVKGKIELMMETRLTEKQFATLSSMNDELDRLSSINKSLILLAKLEHLELKNTGRINLSKILSDRIAYFEDVFAFRNLKVKSSIETDVMISMDENLLIIVLDNLLSNAKRHNYEQGDIDIALASNRLTISNTGNPPSIPEEEVFGRFSRGNPDQNSIGIGLALVKRILEIFGYEISYRFYNERHVVIVEFKI
ncbi:HAMP domain-containing sensor histidine kinase [uncultured Chryseobacterium sp.]|uniref:sensor histidine kinase n=1 Tax=uncultured Chryseobacterium sp. TaxID=259322 RepID=UPI0025E7D0A5|nr:HAMP domain-containing sensor histidine kinase [uncultured Chryseobacterium sp.]